eukprot:352927-Chlamydomonas_euryale.AAC.7
MLAIGLLGNVAGQPRAMRVVCHPHANPASMLAAQQLLHRADDWLSSCGARPRTWLNTLPS